MNKDAFEFGYKHARDLELVFNAGFCWGCIAATVVWLVVWVCI